jgi:hypothetical protein
MKKRKLKKKKTNEKTNEKKKEISSIGRASVLHAAG